MNVRIKLTCLESYHNKENKTLSLYKQEYMVYNYYYIIFKK